MQKKENLQALTGLRFFAALAIFNLHYLPIKELGYQVPSVIESIHSAGISGVSLFFVLSGFILAYSYSGMGTSKNEHWNFLIGRFARVYPVYLLGLIWYAPFILTHRFSTDLFSTAIIKSVGSFFLSFFLVQSWTHPQLAISWNGPGWTLSVELVFYIIFPFIIPYIRNLSNTISIFVCIFTFFISIFFSSIYKFFEFPPSFLYQLISLHPIFHVPSFIFGVALGFYFVHTSVSKKTANLIFYFSTTLILIIASLSNHINDLLLHNSIFLPAFGLLIFGLAAGGGPIRFLSSKLLVTLGQASYSFYILQFSTVSTLMFLNDRNHFHNFIVDGQISPIINGFNFYLLSLIFSITISILVFTFIEEPLRNKIKSRYNIFLKNKIINSPSDTVIKIDKSTKVQECKSIVNVEKKFKES